VPYKNWLAIGMHLYNESINNSDNKENNSDNDENFVFKKIILFDKTIYLDNYIDNLEKIILSTFKYDLIYKNNEIMIYNINDTQSHLTNLLIHINSLNEISKIEIISESRSQFMKSAIYEKLILLNELK
jgi:hypothetical protein